MLRRAAAMTHVLLVHASSSSRQGGSATFLRTLAEYFRSNGVALTLVFLERGALAEEFAGRGFDVVALDAGRVRNVPRSIGAVRAIQQLIRARGITTVFSNGAFEHLYGGMAAWLTGVPSVWYCHACARRSDRTVRLATLVRANAVLTHSEYTKALLAECGKVSATVVYPGVGIPAMNGSGTHLREELGIRPDAPVVSMVAVFMECKGQRVFVRAAARIRDAVPGCKFLLAGDAPFERHRRYADEIRRLVEELGLADSVMFLGFRRDAAAVIGASDVVVHPSTEPEPFGIVLLEAMALGKPVVSIATGGAGEIVGSGEAAVLVPPCDAEATAAACVMLLQNPALGQQLGSAGRQLVERRFSVETMGREVMRCLAEARDGL
jgi:glycosyltransferase involved in cell wall biosynthesis